MSATIPNTTRWQLPRWVIGLIVLCCVIEMVIDALSLTTMPDARDAALVLGAFWSRLLTDGLDPYYSSQPVVMFLSYGFLHGGVLHLAMNMFSLAVVARELAKLTSAGKMLLVYLLSQIAAAGLFAIMAPEAGPMVGASGAIFGLAGALVSIIAIRRRRRGQSLGPLWRAAANVVALNIGLTLLVPSIAWQAHLGGALAGLAAGVIVAQRR